MKSTPMNHSIIVQKGKKNASRRGRKIFERDGRSTARSTTQQEWHNSMDTFAALEEQNQSNAPTIKQKNRQALPLPMYEMGDVVPQTNIMDFKHLELIL